MAEKIDKERRKELDDLYKILSENGRGTMARVLGQYEVPYVLIESYEIPGWMPQALYPQSPLHIPHAFSSYKIDEEESTVEEVRAFLFDRQRRGIADISPIYYNFVRNGNLFIFVNNDNVPANFYDIAALHEFVDGYAQNDMIAEHYEFKEAMRRGLPLFLEYIEWWTRRRGRPKTEEQKMYVGKILPPGMMSFLEEAGFL